MALVTASLGDQPPGEQPVPEQHGARPWSAPGPEAEWWHGDAPDAFDPLGDSTTPVPASPRRPTPARRRRDRHAAATAEPPTTTKIDTPPAIEPEAGAPPVPRTPEAQPAKLAALPTKAPTADQTGAPMAKDTAPPTAATTTSVTPTSPVRAAPPTTPAEDQAAPVAPPVISTTDIAHPVAEGAAPTAKGSTTPRAGTPPAPTARTSPKPARSARLPVAPAPDDSAPADLAPPIWEPATEGPAEWPTRQMRVGRLPRRRMPGKTQRVRAAQTTRRPFFGLLGLVVLGLMAVFFAWSSAEPLWLALGHGSHGTATVTSCRVLGIAERCANFTADDGTFAAEKVSLLGTGPVKVGTKVPAQMVSATASAAYSGNPAKRWVPGLVAVLLCGFGIAWLTGAYRLPGRRARLIAALLSLAGPILLAAGILAATW